MLRTAFNKTFHLYFLIWLVKIITAWIKIIPPSGLISNIKTHLTVPSIEIPGQFPAFQINFTVSALPFRETSGEMHIKPWTSHQGSFYERTFYLHKECRFLRNLLLFKMHYRTERTFIPVESRWKEELKHYNRIIQTKCQNMAGEWTKKRRRLDLTWRS